MVGKKLSTRKEKFQNGYCRNAGEVLMSYKYIEEKAKQIIGDPNFKASQGWVSGFIDRWGFPLRKKITVRQ